MNKLGLHAPEIKQGETLGKSRPAWKACSSPTNPRLAGA